ncbi:MAG: hypothetical protein JSS02_21975 [Planctomycetes bacterium]|nr:hypothetical protein [Planctomycetota bacterium]
MQTVVVVIVAEEGCLCGESFSEDEALTLVAVASEDPACWDDVVACWPRYRTPPVPEFADSLALERVDFVTARATLDRHESWVVIDLVHKRISTGPGMIPIGRDQGFAMVVDESGEQHCPLSVHLPPWWELFEQTDPSAVDRVRETPLAVRRVNREVLFGAPLIADLARRILDIAESAEWPASAASEPAGVPHEFTVRVHRDWLMTPRPELAGLMPRQMLHGAVRWLDLVVWGQRLRFDDGLEIVALPTSVSGYDEAPLGREEVVMYFDLCRELIDSGWKWCVEQGVAAQHISGRPWREHELVAFLTAVQEEWLTSPFEGGSSPQFIIECSRRRVPRGAGVAIAGMTEREAESHVIDCDCPLCHMMADGMFGTAFVGIDGHHLELDDEFAFSLCETREEWEQEQREFAQMSADIDRKQAERAARGETEPDPFASAWSGPNSDEPLPGDPQGHFQLAFLLTEVVGILQAAGAARADLQELNECFSAYRSCERAELPACGQQLAVQLETLAQRYPELVSRVADLQSRIDERIRSAADDNDLPF